jgi:lauroyl/myristoyl acyltransferase
MLPKHLQIQSHISKSGDQITCINTADSSAPVYHPYGGNFSTSACSHTILLKYRFATYPSTPFSLRSHQQLHTQVTKITTQLQRFTHDIQDICAQLNENITNYINDEDT